MSTNPTSSKPNSVRSVKERARSVGLALVGLISLALTITSTTQIIRASLFPTELATELSCSEGVRVLYTSIERARSHAAAQLDGERSALADFRAALEPEWSTFGTIRARCQAGRVGTELTALRKVELLRYAEERAVRYEALDLSRLRRTTPLAIDALIPSPSSP